ncbi:hypothetical protein [Halobacterium litoreum]|uniref:Uncharacterized protein n=1 Tax=Halobacterium litoreum TaxID=2039234 RepID=A0ABD5NDM0_9EURY|nr:hypothetical protein [Halobacterium litoreum]UHH13695.1 hypothetical protein LT972_01555 [Halobacterium litoreum]
MGMGRSLELSGSALLFVFEAVTLVALVVLVGPVLWPIDDPRSAALAGAFALALVALAAAMWRARTVDVTYSPGYDIAWNPSAFPGQAAKERWVKAVRRLPRGEDEDGEE